MLYSWKVTSVTYACFCVDGGTKKLRSTIRRSTETGIAVEMRNRVTRQGSKDSTDGSTNSNSSDGTWVTLCLIEFAFCIYLFIKHYLNNSPLKQTPHHRHLTCIYRLQTLHPNAFICEWISQKHVHISKWKE